MKNLDFTNPSTSPNDSLTDNSKSTKIEKVIIWTLLIIITLLVVIIGQMLLIRPISNNTLIVDFTPLNIFSFFAKEKQVFELRQSPFGEYLHREIFSDVPENLGLYAEWSADKQWIVSNGIHDDSIYNKQIYLMRADGSQQMVIPIIFQGTKLDSAMWPTWSPDGKQIAYYGHLSYKSDTGKYVFKNGIFTLNMECLLRGEACVPMSQFVAQYPDNYELSPSDWSPNGKEIVYSVWASGTYILNVDWQSTSVYSSRFINQNLIRQPKWSPDGTRIVGVCYDGQVDNICLMNKDGSNLHYITNNMKYVALESPRWSADGEMIAYISRFSDKRISGFCPDAPCGYATTIFVIDPYGHKITHLPFNNSVGIHWFIWYP